MKSSSLLLFISCFLFATSSLAQFSQISEQDSTEKPVRLTFENLIEPRSSNFQFLDFNYNQTSSILQKKEVLGALELSRSFLNNNTNTLFLQDFMPMSVSEYNYSVEQQRLSGQIPFRRTSTIGILRFN